MPSMLIRSSPRDYNWLIIIVNDCITYYTYIGNHAKTPYHIWLYNSRLR